MASNGDQTLYGRRCRLTIAIPVTTPGNYSDVTRKVIEINSGDEAAPGLRVQFKIHKDSKKDPNTSEIIVTNLSPSHRGDLQVKGVKVSLDAGYVTTGLTRLFIGDARTIDHVRDGSDWNTTIRLGDGERAIRWARHNESFAGGTKASDILIALANASGLATGNVPTEALKLTKVFYQGYVVSGPVSNSFDQLVKSLGYTSSVQNGTIQLLPVGEGPVDDIPEITPETGLIGSPEMGTPEKKTKVTLVKFRSLLVPTIPGKKVKLKTSGPNPKYNGYVLVKKCSFDGDTRGGNWYTDIEGVNLGA